MLEIDGNYLEGGGQIVRTALALSALTGMPFHVVNIRSGRKDSGLKAQHLHAIKALQELCGASVAGAFEGSAELAFIPKKLKPKKLEIDIGTAGSITLLLQALLLPLIFALKKCSLVITGGTDVAWSCPADYYSHVLMPQLERFAKIKFSIKKRGYYPKGGGVCEIKIKPLHSNTFDAFDEFVQSLKVQSINLVEQGTLIKIQGICNASIDLMERKVAERMTDSAKSILSKYKVPVEMRTEYAQTLSTGCSITLYAVCSLDPDDVIVQNRRIIGADALGDVSVPAETIGKRAAEKLISALDSGAAVDEHLADNLIPFLGLVGGAIKTNNITNHTKTNIYVVEAFLGKRFDIKDNVVSCSIS